MILASHESRRAILRLTRAAGSGVRSHHNSMRVGQHIFGSIIGNAEGYRRGAKRKGTHDANP